MKTSYKIYTMVILLGITSLTGISQNLKINELIARNAKGIVDEFGDDDDWIEIYNPGTTAVNLAGLYISDTNATANYFRIPSFNAAKTTVPAGGHLILWADGEPAEGPNHLPFKLSNGGEGVYLGQLSGGSITLIDAVEFPKLERDVSYGRFPNGTGSFKLLSDPSPGSANLPVRVVNGIVINEIKALNNGNDVDQDGEAEDWIEFYNPTNQTIDLGGLYLTDSIGEKTMHRIPIYAPDSTKIPPGGFLRMWCDAEPRTSILHIDFKLGRGGEKITLTQPDGQTIIQSISYPSASSDASFGQYPDGSGNWIYLNQPSPNQANKYTYTSISGIVINEFLADNSSIYPDNLGEIEDWIEIYNTNNFAVNVGGLILTDSLQQPFRYRIPETYPDSTTIPPKGFLVFWADNQPEQGILHLDFKLTGLGESIGIYQYRSSLVKLDSYTFGNQATNISTGRSPDGSDNWLVLSTPTPGGANSGGSSLIITGLYVNEFVARNTIGYPDEFGNIVDWIELYNSTNDPIDIGGLFFTDNFDTPRLSQIPENQPTKTTIPPKGYLVVWPDSRPDLGPLHVNFQLAGAGEMIGVYQELDGELLTIESITYPAQRSDVSYGRAPDGSRNWNFFSSPTPMAPNPAVGIDDYELSKENLITVFPNPIKEGSMFTVTGGEKGWNYWSILDISGKEVLGGKTWINFNDSLTVDIAPLRNLNGTGVYFLFLRTAQNQFSTKLLIF
jgi:hypothetical protein